MDATDAAFAPKVTSDFQLDVLASFPDAPPCVQLYHAIVALRHFKVGLTVEACL